MATIDITIEGSLLIAAVTGDLSADEVVGVARDYYSTGIKDVIWDLTNGSLNSISRQGFESIARVTKEILSSGVRQGGKTVFVGTASAEFGLMRMYATIAELMGIAITYEVFRTIEEAKNWLSQ
jgi:hypothetical protein